MRALGSAQPNDQRRVLCVDDNELGLFVNATILRSAGYEVLACSDPLRAAAIANSEELDVGVFDYQMPKMNGAELAAMCKTANPDLKVILYSGSLAIPRRELAFADLFVPKSNGVQSLLEGIEALLAQSETFAKSDSRESTAAMRTS